MFGRISGGCLGDARGWKVGPMGLVCLMGLIDPLGLVGPMGLVGQDIKYEKS